MAEQHLKGIGAAEGIAIGPAFYYQPVDLVIPDRLPQSSLVEWSRFEAARDQAQAELAELKALVEARADAESAEIFEAHSLMASDPALAEAVEARIKKGQIVEAAVQESSDEMAAALAAMDDEYFAARAIDVHDVGRRMLRILLDAPDTSMDALLEPSIIVAHDLSPSDTASLDPDKTLGFCTAAGGLTSHTAILARTLGLPAVVGLGSEAVSRIAAGTRLVLDGSTGAVVLNPTARTETSYREQGRALQERQAAMEERAREKAVTADGTPVEVGANVGDLKSMQEAVEFGAEGVGLLRTEFLYLHDTEPPAEEKQVGIYRAIFEAAAGRPVIVRTLDIGGDKPPSYIPFDTELNPFLGWRAIRICLADEALFKTQLRAILRAADGHNVLIMYPMIISVEELRAANGVLAEARQELKKEKLAFNGDVPVGIMVETPAAALVADALAAHCDFFSIGTNDLTQYTLAVDRTNERVASLYQPLHPGVLRLIKLTIDASHRQGIWTGMCGELAGMPQAIPILLGLGLDEFSMVARAIPEAKWLLRRLSVEQAQAIAEAALELGTAAEVEAYMAGVLADLRQ